jgi:uncharacterized RDD family membrane protein YckC
MTRSPRIRVSGHYGGAVTRFLAYAIDVALVVLLFGLGLAAITFVLDLVSSVQVDLEEGDGLLWQIGLPTWGFLYFWVSLTITGRTPGKTVLGLRVVCRDGSPLGARRAFLRVLTFPLAFLFFGLGFVGILIDRERRAIYDLIAGTIVVYDWGDRPAELSTPLSGWLSRREGTLEAVSSSRADTDGS